MTKNRNLSSTPTLSPVIELDNVTKRYGAIVSLDSATLSLPPNEVVILLGPNGAGKTTLLEILTGIRKPDSGKVRVLGNDPIKHSKYVSRRCGVQVQEFSLQATVKVRESLEFFARLYPDPQNVSTLLERFGLHEKANSRFPTLSGGQKRRLGVAKALVGNPEFVILDEPTAGLDPQGKHFLQSELPKLRDEETSVLISTHDFSDAETFADRVVIMSRGSIVSSDLLENSIGKYCGAWRASFLDADSELDLELDGCWEAQHPTVSGRSIFLRDDEARRRFLEANRYPDEIRRSNLADAYFEATGYHLDDRH